MESSIEATWTFPKFNRISLASRKELLKFMKNCSRMDLIWVRFVIKDFPSRMDRVSDNDDFGNILFAACLVNATFNSEKLSFCTSDKGSVMNCLDHWMVEGMNVGDRDGDVVLDAHISYNDCHIGRGR